MRTGFSLLFALFAFVSVSVAGTPPVSVRLPEERAWVGQHLSFFVELRAAGSFSGAASFDLPQLPGIIIIKIGAPVVSSKEIDGQSWFTQEHEFALFSQKAEILEVPRFPIRFASRSGFTGPASDVNAEFPGMNVTIERPPGSENIDFLVTTESLDIAETWTPTPGPVEAGAIFKRTITQRAAQLSGMALAPASARAPDGINVYLEDPIIKDTTERGDFTGERIETITYQMIKAGSFTLPELTYVWWNPKTEKMEKHQLPPVTFTVTGAPSVAPAQQSIKSYAWLVLPVAVLLFMVWQRAAIVGWVRRRWIDINPADRVLAKKLLRACRHNNITAASDAWLAWRNTQAPLFQPGTELQLAVMALQQCRFGPGPEDSWNGQHLALVFANHLKAVKENTSDRRISVLPRLN